ncbi:MAG: ribonuclease Y [Spartobacteria bacterium]|nr:ribonuclease Y [Spartobacteria bacterium]
MLQIPWWLPTVTAFLGIVLGFFSGYVIHLLQKQLKDVQAEKDSRNLITDARREAEHIVKEAKLQANSELLKCRHDFAKEKDAQRDYYRTLDERISAREISLDHKADILNAKEEKLESYSKKLDTRNESLNDKKLELEQLHADELVAIQRVADLSSDEARSLLLKKIEVKIQSECNCMIHHMIDEAKETAEIRARDIITQAIQRYAANQSNAVTTCALQLSSDEMKGRIIGRDGRNIRSFEMATGVDLLIDETPGSVVISSFDPVRREVARTALEKLIEDGRIHPARIEEVVSSARNSVAESIQHAGEKAIYELGLSTVDPAIMNMVGTLKFRHSYGQNILDHSMEMAYLMGMMAAELNMEQQTARRIGLFHDIGKAMDHKIQGPHAQIGAHFLRQHGESDLVVQSVEAHHGETDYTGPYAALATAADAITASRPGARTETTEIYLKRLAELEKLAESFHGVDHCYAIQAGREIRVMVQPNAVDDNELLMLARRIAKEIHEHMDFPGQIKVTVIRETRCIEYAR